MTYRAVVPAIIPQSAVAVREYTARLAFSRELHLDVVDGTFVPAISWPYQPIDHPRVVKSETDKFTLEVDLMVQDPIPAAKQWVEAGADMLVFHVETISQDVFANLSFGSSVSLGISASGDTSLETLLAYIPYADYVQVMGIHQIGSQGQPFHPPVLEWIREIKLQFPHISLSVDGSVNTSTITELARAGADRFIVGSAIVGASDPEAAQAALIELING